jgi:hypothetical protein
MADHGELVEVGVSAWLDGRRDTYVSQTIAEAYEGVQAVIAAVEPIIRVEAYARAEREVLEWCCDDTSAALRSKVEGLRVTTVPLADADGEWIDVLAMVRLADVLALLDKGADVPDHEQLSLW